MKKAGDCYTEETKKGQRGEIAAGEKDGWAITSFREKKSVEKPGAEE